jgi:predicted aspartyl protease
MGFVYIDIKVKGLKASKNIKMLADTGSMYIVLDPKTIGELGLFETPYSVKLTLADKREIETKLFLAEVEAGGRKGPAFVAAVDTPTPLLGVYALETLGFKVDVVSGRLEEISPEGGYLLSC